MPKDIKRIRQLAAIVALASVPAIAAAQNPPSSRDSLTPSAATQESGGDVDTNNGGGSKWGWLGLLGLIGLAGMRRRHTTVETTPTGRRL
jgi:MYXO-CTERM domain-containing protein